jgi:TolA-binding protein
MYSLGRNYTVNKDFDKAIQVYEKFLYVYPDHELAPDVRKRVQDVYLMASTQDPKYAEQLAAKYPASDKAAEALFYQASQAYQNGDEEKSADLFFRVANEFPNSPKTPEALYTAGALYLKQKKYQQAIQALKKYKDFFPDGSNIQDVYNYLQSAYMAANDFGSAIQIGQEALQKFPDSKNKSKILFNIGWSYSQLGNSREAINYLQQAKTLYEQEGNTQMVSQIDQILQVLPK